MTDNHQESYADFPAGILVGAVVISLAITTVLSVYTFGMGGHGATQQQAMNTPAATQQKK